MDKETALMERRRMATCQKENKPKQFFNPKTKSYESVTKTQKFNPDFSSISEKTPRTKFIRIPTQFSEVEEELSF